MDYLRDKVIFGLGIYTGLRISEILQLKQDHVFTANGSIRQQLICKRLKKRGTVYSDIPVHPKLYQPLDEYHRQVAENQWLFPSDESVAGCLSRARALYDAFKKLNSHAGILLRTASAWNAREFLSTPSVATKCLAIGPKILSEATCCHVGLTTV